MCGIVGYVGNENTVDKLHKGLKSLEYRGYDSAGIAFFCEKSLKIIKSVGCVDCLFEKVYAQKCKDKSIGAGIGHTRWATHGKASENNSHPHQSEQKRVCIVHNGIIENYLEIKEKLLQGVKFKSETDTEVVANLIENKLFEVEKMQISNPNNALSSESCNLKAMQIALQQLKGSFALGILFLDDPGRIYFAKQTSPLLIGISGNGKFLASDILGFDNTATEFVEIFDGQFGYISKDKIHIFDKTGKMVNFSPKTLHENKNNTFLGNFSHYMQKEIFEIPKSIENTANLYLSNKLQNAFKKTKSISRNISRIFLVACGTSFHACKVGELWLRQIGYDATSDVASEFIYSPQILNKNTLCIFVSQSGETADTISAIKLAKKHHAKTIGITNVETSTMAKICDVILPLRCGPEIAVASTKAYNTQICVLKILSEFLKYEKQNKNSTNNEKYANSKTKKLFNKNKVQSTLKIIKKVKNNQKNANNWQKSIENLQNFSKNIKIASFEKQIKDIVKDVVKAKNIFMVGKNFDSVLAMESALKLKEISYLNTQAYPSGELKHGTISLIDSNSLVFAFATEKKLSSKTMNIAEQVHARGAKVVLVTPFKELANNKSIYKTILLPKLNEKYYPILAIIPMQLLSYNVSIMLGNNPDKPRNLAKSVTVE